MKRALTLICAVALLTVSCSPSPKSESDSGARVMVLGIDGATWTVIEPMMEKGELPNIKKLYDKGLHGVLESRPPIISPVVWTTIFTGFGHQKHGVKDWKTSQSVNRRVSAIWEILRDQNRKVSVFNVPASWPPDPIPGVMLSGFPLSGSTQGGNTGEPVTAEALAAGKVSAAFRDSVPMIRETAATLKVGEWSPWLDGKVASRPQFEGKFRIKRVTEKEIYLTPLYRVDGGLVISEPKSLRSEMSKKFGEPYIPEGPGWSKWAEKYTPEVLYEHLEQVFSTQSKAALEFADKDWKLFLYVMTLVDRVSHPYWAFSEPQTFPTLDRVLAKKYESRVADSYRRTDEEVGKLLSKINDETYVLIVSDHGFQASMDKTKPIGTHHPSGVYLLAGPGIKAGSGVPKYIEDVTPTLLYLLGMPTGQDMDGRIFAEVVDQIGRKPESVPTHEKVGRDATDEPVDNATWRQLQDLGYVDGAPPREAGGAKQPADAEGGKKKSGQPKQGESAAPSPNPLEDWPEKPN